MSGAMTEKGFRLDIQGIRGFALIIVLACHAELPYTEGGFVGLDIFFVLSGFLITGLIVTEIERRGTLSLLNFYARRAKRLLPLAVTVLGLILLGSLLIFSTVRKEEAAGDVLAATLYFVNWRFIAQQVDFFAWGDSAISPVQHYWSLSVEEQFYIVWPIALLLVSLWAFRAGWNIRRALWLLIAPIGLLSLYYCLTYTTEAPQAAYFSTLCRVWQLSAGAALMLALPTGLRMPRWLSALLTVAGIATLLITTATFHNTDPYPGWRSLFPVLSTAAVIVAGTAVAVSGPIWLLCQRPLQYLGKISYAWYLWHWPVIVFAAALLGPLSTPAMVLITLLSWIPATISHHLIEERFRRSKELNRRPRTAMAIGMSFTVTAVVLALVVRATGPNIPTAPIEAVAGAEVIDNGNGTRKQVPLQRRAHELRPNPLHAREDRGKLFEDGCLIKAPDTDPPPCVYGDPDSDVTVVIFGDSHALQYTPALERLANRNGWRMVAIMRASCVIAAVDYKPGCTTWIEKALDRIAAEQPALIISATGTTSRYRVKIDGEELSRADSQPYLVQGFQKIQKRLMETGAKLALIRDQARSPFIVHECVTDAMDNLRKCAFKPQRLEQNAFDLQGVAKMSRVKVIDPLPVVCPNDLCPGVIGNAVVYRDSYHFSATFARTLAPWLGRELPSIPKPGRDRQQSQT